MHIGYFDPDKRAAEKAASREKDMEAIASGRKSAAQVHFENGGQGLFRNAKLIRKPYRKPGKSKVAS